MSNDTNLVHELIIFADTRFPGLIEAVNGRIDSGGGFTITMSFTGEGIPSSGKAYERLERQKIGSIPGADIYSYSLVFTPEQENDADWEAYLLLEKFGNILTEPRGGGMMEAMGFKPAIGLPMVNSTFLRLLDRLNIRELDNFPLVSADTRSQTRGTFIPSANKVVYCVIVTQTRQYLNDFLNHLLDQCTPGNRATCYGGVSDLDGQSFQNHEIDALKEFAMTFSGFYETKGPIISNAWAKLSEIGRKSPLWDDLGNYFGGFMDMYRVFFHEGYSPEDYLEKWNRGDVAPYFALIEETASFKKYGDSYASFLLFNYLLLIENHFSLKLLPPFKYKLECTDCGFCFNTKCQRGGPPRECPHCNEIGIVSIERRRCSMSTASRISGLFKRR